MKSDADAKGALPAGEAHVAGQHQRPASACGRLHRERLMDVEVEALTGAAPGVRGPGRLNQRSTTWATIRWNPTKSWYCLESSAPEVCHHRLLTDRFGGP
jgi:hypothetical protein